MRPESFTLYRVAYPNLVVLGAEDGLVRSTLANLQALFFNSLASAAPRWVQLLPPVHTANVVVNLGVHRMSLDVDENCKARCWSPAGQASELASADQQQVVARFTGGICRATLATSPSSSASTKGLSSSNLVAVLAGLQALLAEVVVDEKVASRARFLGTGAAALVL